VLRVLLDDPAGGRDAVFAAVAEHAATLRRYELVQPTLEDVFVRLVGPGNERDREVAS
jgi:hypothetical protein